jgi:DNA-binding NarL/FixJ family response regulator
VADAAGDRHEATRALCNVGFALLTWVRPDEALRHARQALAYAEEHEEEAFVSYAACIVAWLRLRAGEWDEAERMATGVIGRGVAVPQLLARTVLTELAVRRGDPDASARLADLRAQADRAGELQRIAPVLALETELALTSGARPPAERFAEVATVIRPHGEIEGNSATWVAAWAAVAGVVVDYDSPMSEPHAAMLRRDWLAAAEAFAEVGWQYERALMLSLLEDEEALGEALEVARGLGAEPLTKRVAARMRELGLRVPSGPRETARTNAAGLTARQLEVLELLVGGLTNAEIAERLVVSPRTAEHHVAAVLTKLRATSRRDAVRRASELGLLART